MGDELDNGLYTDVGIVELRRYVTRPDQRDTLIDLFEREFIESQEACGMLPAGQYRDLDDPNAFVWLRTFPNMKHRRPALEAFYLHSQAWADHRDAANATMIDSDNVLLLRNARNDSGLDLHSLTRPTLMDSRNGTSLVAASIIMLDTPASDAYISTFEEKTLPRVQKHARRVSYLVTEERPNDFPRLPVRESEYAFVVLGICSNADAMHSWTRVFEKQNAQTLRLQPTTRSLFA